MGSERKERQRLEAVTSATEVLGQPGAKLSDPLHTLSHPARAHQPHTHRGRSSRQQTAGACQAALSGLL